MANVDNRQLNALVAEYLFGLRVLPYGLYTKLEYDTGAMVLDVPDYVGEWNGIMTMVAEMEARGWTFELNRVNAYACWYSTIRFSHVNGDELYGICGGSLSNVARIGTEIGLTVLRSVAPSLLLEP